MSELGKRRAPSGKAAAPLFVVVEGVSAGFAVREGASLRFRAVHPRFDLLDGSRFHHLDQLRCAAERLASASRDETGDRP
jgi:hypothetical protein